MQIYEAEFYPIENEKKKSAPYIKICAGLLCAALLAGLSIRLFSWFKSSSEAELLSLVNRWNSVEAADFKLQLCDIGGGLQADRRCRAELNKMLSDCRLSGASPRIISAYRSFGEQERLYEYELSRREVLGMSRTQAEKMAENGVDRPGYCEHELGLAFDIAEKGRDTSEQSPSVSWLMENSWRYGFILRYPAWAEEVTGRSFQPFHYRYVGKEAAEQMWEMKICLEDYIEMFYSNEATVIVEN